MVRAPYFVYNPWVTGAGNFEWLNDNMPQDAKAVMIDVEVRKEGYSSVVYAAEVSKFCDLAMAKWKIGIYTGEWFLPYLSTWRKDVDYWWAQYPLAFYPSERRELSWDQLRAELEPFAGPANASRCPGTLRMWQFSGDKLILPGNNRAMDVNAFFGSLDELKNWLGYESVPDGGNMIYQGTVMVSTLNVRSVSNSTNNTPIGQITNGDKLEADRVENGWWHLTTINGSATTQESWAFEGASGAYIRLDGTTTPPMSIVSDMPFTMTLGGGLSPYAEYTVTGVVKAK